MCLSFILTFLLLFYNKEKILYLIAPLNLCYTNIIEIFWCYLYFIIYLSVLINIPLIIQQVVFFLKSGLFEKEYYHIKFYSILLSSAVIINCFITFYYILPWIINFSSTFNSEQISMQITFLNYIKAVITFFNLFIIGLLMPLIFLIYRFKRLNFYLMVVFCIFLISPLDPLNTLIIIIFYFFISELFIYLHYYLTSGFDS